MIVKLWPGQFIFRQLCLNGEASTVQLLVYYISLDKHHFWGEKFSLLLFKRGLFISFRSLSRGSDTDSPLLITNMFHVFQKDGDFMWDKTVQGQILGAFFWPYAICQIPSGILITKMGFRKLFGFCMILASFTTILVPILASYSSWYVIILRAAQGIFQVNIQ